MTDRTTQAEPAPFTAADFDGSTKVVVVSETRSPGLANAGSSAFSTRSG